MSLINLKMFALCCATLWVRLAQSFGASLARTFALFRLYSLCFSFSVSLAVTFRCRQLMAKLLEPRSLRGYFIKRRQLGRDERVCSDSRKKKNSNNFSLIFFCGLSKSSAQWLHNQYNTNWNIYKKYIFDIYMHIGTCVLCAWSSALDPSHCESTDQLLK